MTGTYTNPVFDGYFADPFVLKYNGEYYAYGTGSPTARTFGVLHSTDLVHWQDRGEALVPLDEPMHSYWAPEVAYDNGTFYMYYSAGGAEGAGHQLRVATALQPTGPFHDTGRILTPDDPFTIDAHPFRDEDGTWYLFYCHDFLDGERVGTGIMVDRMLDMLTLAGEPRTVVRPHADWNLYERQRTWYERVWDWYTIEGAFVRKHQNRYYCFYSGGAWREPTYGVGYAVADHPLGPYTVETGAEEGPKILRTLPGTVIGPGHASITVAPDNLHQYIVYHAWDVGNSGRLMRIDPLHWTDAGPSSPGPSFEEHPAPPQPLFRDLFDRPADTPWEGHGWQVVKGEWRIEDGAVVQADCTAAFGALLLDQELPGASYVFEANVMLKDAIGSQAGVGVYVSYVDQDTYVALELLTDQREFVVVSRTDGEILERHSLSSAPLGTAFLTTSYHQMLVTRRGTTFEVCVDGVSLAAHISAPPAIGQPGLFTHYAAAAFDGVAITMLDQEGA